MGLLQQDKVVFYHPLDDSTEWTQSEAWDGTADYGLGKVDNALEAVATVEGFGGASEYTATEAIFNHIAALNSSKVVVAYQNLTGLSGRARVGTISGTGITWGAVSPFMTTATGGARTPIAVLSETKVVVAYQEGADSKNGKGKVGTISGTDITWGAEAEFLSVDGAYHIAMAVAVLSESKVIVAYSNGNDDGHGEAKIGTVSGLTIAWGGESEFHSVNSAGYISVAALGNSKVVVVYCDYTGDLFRGKARVGAVAGTGVSWGAVSQFQPSDKAYFNNVVALSETKVVVAWQNYTGVCHGQAKVGTVSGLDITFGAASEFLSTDNTTNYAFPALAALSGSMVIVAYEDKADGKGKARVGTVSGTAIAWGSESTFQPASGADWNGVAALTGSKAVVVFKDVADSPGHGKANVWQAGSSASSLAGESASYPGAAGGAKVAFCGWFRKPSA